MYICVCGYEFTYPRIEVINDNSFEVVCPNCGSVEHNCSRKYTEKSSVVIYARKRKFIDDLFNL